MGEGGEGRREGKDGVVEGEGVCRGSGGTEEWWREERVAEGEDGGTHGGDGKEWGGGEREGGW